MGMIFYGRRLTADELAAVDADPDAAPDLLDPHGDDDEGGDGDGGQGDGRVIDLDKAWHGIHYLLTGTDWDVSEGAGEAILGGAPVGEDCGYGPARLLAAERVQAVHAALAPVDGAALATRYDTAAMATADIYPSIWDEGDDARDYVLGYYDELRAFYAAAAADHEAVLLAIM